MTATTAFVLTHESNPQRVHKSTSFIALALTRSLGRKGVSVVRLHPNLLDRSVTSRYCSGVEICPDFYASESDLVEFLLKLETRYPGHRVLIPASDDCAYFVSRHRDVLQRSFDVVAPPWSVMEKVIDKKRQYEAAAAVGVPIPETYFPAGIDDVRHLVPQLDNYPYVIKPIVAHQWRRSVLTKISKGKKGFAVRNAAELLREYERISAGDPNVMIQEVIGGRDERLFTFLAYFDVQSEPLRYCIRKKIRQLPIDFGYCTLTESCYDEKVEEQSIRLLKALRFQGICGVEWKLDPRTGLYKLIEINPRAVNTTGIAAACGADIPFAAFADRTDMPLEPQQGWKSGVKWVCLTQDLWAARALRRNGQLSLLDWWRSLRGPMVHAVFAWDDVRPFIGYFLDFLRMRVRESREKQSA